MVNAPPKSTVISVELPRLGTCAYDEADVFVFPWGLPGFEELRTFIVIQLESQDRLYWLQSLEDLGVALPLGDPWTFFPQYEPKLPAFAEISLDLVNPEDFTLLAVMVGAEGGRTFMNLMAPIVLNLKNHIGRQIPLETGRYTVAMEIQVPEAVRAQAEANSE